MADHHNLALGPPERQWRAVLALGVPLALLGAPLVMSLGELPLCAFRHVTGVPCPLCGGTRLCAALAQGNLVAAWQANPGLLVVLALVAVYVVQLAVEAWTGRRLQRWRMDARFLTIGFAVLMLGWVLRLLGWL